MRKMGIDFGNKRIGIAISDALNITAQAKGVITRTDLRQDLKKIIAYIEKYDVDEIIVGLPKNMDGTLGPQAEKIMQFVNFLNNNLDLPIELWDERLTTVSAERMLIEADLSRARRKKVIDKVAASIILQNYLDALNTGGLQNAKR